MSGTRYLLLVRHAEPTSDETGLSDVGRQQASLLGRRLRGAPFDAVHHGPLPRAAQTAALIAEHLPGVAVGVHEAAGDYVPYAPASGEIPGPFAERVDRFLAEDSAADLICGAELAASALASFTGPVAGERPRWELVVTHNFTAAWLVRDALDAPAWRWLTVDHAHAALTVLRYEPDRPATVLVLNDTGHLPSELRWTGYAKRFAY